MRPSSLLAVVCTLAGFGYVFSQEAPVGHLNGQVLHGKTKRPVADARVFLIPHQHPHSQRGLSAPGADRASLTSRGETADSKTRHWYRTSTDADGTFTITGAEAGLYRATAHAPGLGDQSTTVTLGEGTTHVSLALRPATLPVPRRTWPIKIPLTQPPPDPRKVQVRTMDIVRARYNLSRELYDTIRANNLSGLPIEIVLAQAGAESSFWVTHGGKLKEIGLFQLRPVTANDQGLGKFTDQQIQNAALNTRLATTYMKTLTAMFGDVRIALVAYNQGPGNTMRKGLLPRAQIYADAILQASRHSRFQARLRALDPQFRPHAGVPTIRRTSGQNSTGPSPDTQPKPPINAPMRMRAATPANARPQQPRP